MEEEKPRCHKITATTQRLSRNRKKVKPFYLLFILLTSTAAAATLFAFADQQQQQKQSKSGKWLNLI